MSSISETTKQPPIAGPFFLGEEDIAKYWLNWFLELSKNDNIIINYINDNIDQGVKTTDSPTFVTLTLTGGSVHPVSIKVNDYAVLGTDYSLIIDATSNTVTLTLPLTPVTGQVYKVSCKDSTFTADIDFNGKTFDGDSGNFELFEDESVNIIYDGTEWRTN